VKKEHREKELKEFNNPGTAQNDTAQQFRDMDNKIGSK
jgi:hypothetical protein